MYFLDPPLSLYINLKLAPVPGLKVDLGSLDFFICPSPQYGHIEQTFLFYL